jgi:DNA-3-methyladenine glycosylase
VVIDSTGHAGAGRGRLTRADVPWETEDLARFLIGALVVRRFDDASIACGRIVETEAYTQDDPASHSFRGRTTRNRVMFEAHFHAYVYLIYGTAHCLNVSSEGEGVGAAVLIRALEPVAGLDAMRRRRGASVADRDLARGPGRLCRALDIDLRLDGVDLETDSRIWLAAGAEPRPAIGVSRRIGLTRAAEIDRRYYARGSRYVSGRRSLSPGG